jgi:hypothetical protein
MTICRRIFLSLALVLAATALAIARVAERPIPFCNAGVHIPGVAFGDSIPWHDRTAGPGSNLYYNHILNFSFTIT